MEELENICSYLPENILKFLWKLVYPTQELYNNEISLKQNCKCKPGKPPILKKILMKSGLATQDLLQEG